MRNGSVKIGLYILGKHGSINGPGSDRCGTC